MKRAIALISVFLFFAVMAVDGHAEDNTIDDAIQNTILSQIEAFANDDRQAAWDHASEGIKQQSGSIESFYDMVKLSYAPVHRASSIEFMERIPHPGFQIQVVRLLGPEGKRWIAHYHMVKNGDDWKIGGVGLKEGPSSI